MNPDSLLSQFRRLTEAPNALDRLRQFVLTLAVSGRLTSRNRQPWSTVTLGQIGAWGSGGTPNRGRSEYFGGTIPWVVIGDLNEGVVTRTTETITDLGLANSSAKLIEPGTVLIAMYGASVGKLGIAGMRCATNQAIAHCAPNHSVVERDYLFLLVKSLRPALIESGRGGAQPNISQTILKFWPVLLPALPDQRRVIQKVDEMMALCDGLEATQTEQERHRDELTRASLERLTSVVSDSVHAPSAGQFVFAHFDRISARRDQLLLIRNAILDLAVRGQLVTHYEPDEAQARAPQITWSSSSLGEICQKITDGTHRTPTYVSAGVAFVSVKDFSAGELSFASTRFITPAEHQELVKRCDPRRGDVLMGRIGTLGKAVVVDTDQEFSLFVSVGLLRPDAAVITPEYLRLFLNSPVATRTYDRIKVGGGTHTNKLNLGDLRKMELSLPPLAEQHRIVAKVDELMAVCGELERSLTAAETGRSRLLEAVLQEALAERNVELEPVLTGVQ
jgi:type I restriction enzyme S subunit